MKLIKSPEPYSPAFGEVLYAVALDENEAGAEVSIFNSAVTEKIGIKKAAGAPEFTLNVADYLRAQADVKPFPVQPCGLIDGKERRVVSCIAHDNWSSSCPHTAGVAAVATNEPMCEAGPRSLARGEQDEISWVGAKGPVCARALFPDGGQKPIGVELGRVELSEPHLIALIVNADHLDRLLAVQGRAWDEFTRFSVELDFGDQKIAVFEYRIRPLNPRATRLAWWNRRGGVDLHTFEASVEHRAFEAAGSRVERTLRTACTTRAQALRLAEIPGAPRVWIVEGDTHIPVKAAVEKTFPIDDTEETVLEIRVAEIEKIPFPIL